ncbi:uncharacterized protein LOC135150514 [Daucus carota subsp. sativus]|uniref:uncharacterized protein LOC135150514 n=1 Tax=Daucus carota subsp. sativus TaxID=79200 RepID=UPI003083E34F
MAVRRRNSGGVWVRFDKPWGWLRLKRRRRLVAAYEFDDLEPAQDVNPEPIPTTTNEPAQPSPKPARFKRRAHKPKRAKIPEPEITDFTIQEEQTPSTQVAEDSQPLMVDPLQAVPLISPTVSPTTSPKATSTASAVDEEIECDAQATNEAGAKTSDPKSPISDHGHSTPIPHSPMKIPENAIVHDTAPENYRSDVVDESDKVAVEALQSLAQTGEEPIKTQSEAQGKSAQDTVEQVADPVPADEKANSDPENDTSSDTDKDENAEVPLTQQKWESTSQFNARQELVEEFQTLTVQNLSKVQSLFQSQHTMSHLGQSRDQWLDQINQ